MSAPLDLPTLGLIAAVGSAAIAYIYKLSIRLTVMETRFSIFWSTIEKQLPKVLIRPTHERIDKLLLLMSGGSLSESERLELAEALKSEIDSGLHTSDPVKAIAYVFLIARLESGLVGSQVSMDVEKEGGGNT